MKTGKILLASFVGLLSQIASAGTVDVGYDVNAPTGNFGSPGSTSDNVAYSITMSSTASAVNLQFVANPAAGGALNGLNFANLYFDTTAINPATGSDVGFEIENNDTFVPGVTSPVSTAGDGITYTAAPGDLNISIPWSYFTTDPQSLGFTPISAANNVLRLDLSQSFGYSVAGGSAAYGTTELGEAIYSAPDATSTAALVAISMGALGLIRRRK